MGETLKNCTGFRVREGGPVGGYCGGIPKLYCGNLMFGKKGKLLCEEKVILSLA